MKKKEESINEVKKVRAELYSLSWNISGKLSYQIYKVEINKKIAEFHSKNLKCDTLDLKDFQQDDFNVLLDKIIVNNHTAISQWLTKGISPNNIHILDAIINITIENCNLDESKIILLVNELLRISKEYDLEKFITDHNQFNTWIEYLTNAQNNITTEEGKGKIFYIYSEIMKSIYYYKHEKPINPSDTKNIPEQSLNESVPNESNDFEPIIKFKLPKFSNIQKISVITAFIFSICIFTILNMNLSYKAPASTLVTQNSITDKYYVPANTTITGNETLKTTLDLKNVHSAYIFSFTARNDFPQLAGSSANLKILVNGKTISKQSLINKPQIQKYDDGLKEKGLEKYNFTYSDERQFNWYDNSGFFEVFYAPDMWSPNIASDPYCVLGGEATLYEFDITPYLKSGENIIELYNSGICSSKKMVLDELHVRNEIRAFDNAAISPGKSISKNFNIDNPSYTHMIRFFSRLNSQTSKNYDYTLKINLDKKYNITKEDIINKPTIAYGYIGNSRYQYTLKNGNILSIINDQGLLLIPNSNNMYSHNIDLSNDFRAIGGEAYKYDIAIPQALENIGNHTLNLENCNTNGLNLVLEDLKVYEFIPNIIK